MIQKPGWCRRAVFMSACMIAALAMPAAGDPWLQFDDYEDWWDALYNYPPEVSGVNEAEWGDHMYQWEHYLTEGEPYPPTEFLSPELYVYGGGGGGGYPEEAGLVMVWGTDPALPAGEYASAWRYDYLLDPDLSNAVIKVSVFPPAWGSTGRITQVSFGIRDIMGRTRSWYWNVGPAGPLPSNVITPITIYASRTGLNATVPPATGYMNTPGFDITAAQFFLVDENAQWLGGPLPIPPPGGPPLGLWNYWNNLQVLPEWQLVKWHQPPDPAFPQNVYYGWNQHSDWWYGPIAADDWLCTTPEPVTGINWWGSFIGWKHPYPPPMPSHFHLQMWTDVPGMPPGFSHPGEVIWETWAYTYTVEWVGWDYDPRTKEYESCFKFKYALSPWEYFYQEPGPGGVNVYWLSVSACEGGPPPPVPFGWKTRPRDPQSPAPDAAVVTWDPIQPVLGSQWVSGYPLYWPDEQSPWDLAFELTAGAAAYKWLQPPQPYIPEDAYNGWDELSMYSVQIAADDWVCTTDNPVVEIRWWGSFIGWYHPWLPPQGVPAMFHVAIWTDVPADPTQPASFSHPGEVIHEILCDHFDWEFVGWDFDPRAIDQQPPPEATFKFAQYLDPGEWFWQEPGGNIYWISIAAMYPAGQVVDYPWGWKTRPRDPDSPAPDDAVWIADPAAPVLGSQYVNGGPLFYPTPQESWDLAFELISVPRDRVVCEPQGAVGNPLHPPTYWYDVTPDDFGRCDFHVQVFDPDPLHYTNIVSPPTWLFAVHPDAMGQWWASWWDPDCDNAIFTMFRFQFDHPGPSTWGDWTTTIGATSDPHDWVVDRSQNHAHQPDGWGYRVHAPLPPLPGDSVVCEPQGAPGNPTHPPIYWYDVLVGGGYGRCDFHVQVYDPKPANYTNVVAPPTWLFAVHQLPNGEWWASWWDPDCSDPLWPGMVFRFQFDNPNANAWGGWTTTDSSSSDPYAGVVDWWLNHATEPDGYGYRVHVPQPAAYAKWQQPPLEDPRYPGYFYGWNEPTLYLGPQVVADDFKCCDERPISDIHWWGSYLNWLEPVPPPPSVAPCCFHLGLWTDVPAGDPQNPFPWSHPGVMFHEWWVLREQLNERPVGVDFHPQYGYETCFAYDFLIPESAWFYQPDAQATYWLSIAAAYDVQPPPEHLWGWKTRRRHWNDDAVRIFAPLPPTIGQPFETGQPIEDAEGSWDMAFVLTTPIAPPGICRGDLNGDNLINFGDINPFVLRLSNPAAYHELYPCVPEENADVNGNGVVGFDDINPFVALLSQQPPPTCPNP